MENTATTSLPDSAREEALAAAAAHDWESTVRLAEGALELPEYQDDGELWRALGNALGRLKRYGDAVRALDRARGMTPLDALDVRMELLSERNVYEAHRRRMAILYDPRMVSHDFAGMQKQLGMLFDLERNEDAFSISTRLVPLPEATAASWIARARLARIVLPPDEAAPVIAAAVKAAMDLEPDDRTVRLVCEHLLRPRTPSGSLPPRLTALGYAIQRDGTREVVVPPLRAIAAGAFQMGSDRQRDVEAFADELPRHAVDLAAYDIMRYPVTVAEYARFVWSGQAEPPKWDTQLLDLDLPVGEVAWYDAVAYADWLSAQTNATWRLPTEAEWEQAARWDISKQEARIYPWGGAFDPARANTDVSAAEMLTPVGCYPEGASPFGVEDLAGGVYEWTASQRAPYPYHVDDGRETRQPTATRVVRGGARHCPPRLARAACRGYRSPVDRGPLLGFRLVRVRGAAKINTDLNRQS